MPVHGGGSQVALEGHAGLQAQQLHRAALQVEKLSQKKIYSWL